MFGISTHIASVKDYFTFNDCRLFCAVVSATDPGNKSNIFFNYFNFLDYYFLFK